MRFGNKVAVVTRAGKGIGEGYAKALGKEGAAIVNQPSSAAWMGAGCYGIAKLADRS